MDNNYWAESHGKEKIFFYGWHHICYLTMDVNYNIRKNFVVAMNQESKRLYDYIIIDRLNVT